MAERGRVIFPTHRLSILLAGAALSLVSCDADRPFFGPETPGVAYVVPYGTVPAAELRRAELALAELTGRPVKHLPARPLPASALVKMCDGHPAPIPCREPTYDASTLLDETLRELPADTFRVLAVTVVPLRTPAHESLIGYARNAERAMVYSARAPGVYLTEAEHRRRVRHVVAHELGHTYGAPHCDKKCVMHDVHRAADVAHHTDRPCSIHRAHFDRGRDQSIDDARFVAAVGAEQMRIGAWDASVSAFEQATHIAPDEPRHLTALGIALMGSGRLLAAEEALSAASLRAPWAPQPYYARAVLYAAGHAPFKAPAHLEAAVDRDGDPVRAHRAAGILYQDVLDIPKAAIRHFEAHIHHGGRDPRVIARLVYLLSPTTLTFSIPEVIIARWEPGEGLIVAALPAKR